MSTLNDTWRKLSKDAPARPVPVQRPARKRRPHPLVAYKQWWVGQRARPANYKCPFRRVVDVRWYGPPSGVYGTAELVYEDGAAQVVSTPAHRPRKCDVEIES